MVQGIADYSLWNMSNQINLRRGQTLTLCIRFRVFFSLGDASCFHVFPAGRGRLSFSVQGKKIMFSGNRNIILPDNTRKIIFQHNLFGKTIFSGHPEKENLVFCVVKGDNLIFFDNVAGLPGSMQNS